MAGFLDKDTRVLDVVLTNYGKRLLSSGDLHFCYWAPFDDEIDYNPIICQSASMTNEQLSSSITQYIEDTPVREAVYGYKNFNNKYEDTTNVNRMMFTRAQGQKILPRALFPDVNDTTKIDIIQRRIVNEYAGIVDGVNKVIATSDVGVERFDSTFFTFELSYDKDSFPPNFDISGFKLTMLKSGSSGFEQLSPKRDMNNDLSFDSNVKMYVGVKK